MKNLSLVLTLLAACVPSAPFHPVTITAPADPLAKASRVLIDHGASIDIRDDGGGVVVTKWDDETVRMGDKYRYRWKVTVNAGSLTVDSQCQWKMTDPAPGQSADWTSCGNQPAERGTQASAIAADIGKN